MRLNQIKLAGFKSFVDPTHLNIPGDLVGVVGPNGCGKSNIIDAVRWVLGESRASALRGDSMQDVIFNGSTLRKPVARASVELVFDNSLGRAAGQWSQYAEISVKRVLTRDGESSYLINNTQVRRKDIHDIFLGTGLGPRAYAIIEQGMISRIIEAKPEELRVFLEEAAGVSKYKDRRRETENRLADTRDNLARVGDIREELAGQIEKLDRQAEIARQFNELSVQRQHKQHVLWVLKRQEAEDEAQRFMREIDKVTNQLELVTANLREIERQLETDREEHYASGDALSAAQGDLFATNSEVARLEGEIRHISELRQRLEAELAQHSAQVALNARRSQELADAGQLWEKRLDEMRIRGDSARDIAAEELARLPGIEEAFRAAQVAAGEAKDKVTATDHAHRLEQTHKAHSEKLIQGLIARDERLIQELSNIADVDDTRIRNLECEIRESQSAEVDKKQQLDKMEAACADLEAKVQTADKHIQAQELAFSAVTAKLGVLEGIQQRLDSNGSMQNWLDEHGLNSHLRLWQGIRVEAGWEAAVESVLREKLHAIHVSDPDEMQRVSTMLPPGGLTLFSAGVPVRVLHEHGLRPLGDVVSITDPAVEPVLMTWLQSCYAVEGTPSLEAREQLPAGVLLVNRDGQQFSRFAISFFASDASDSGILARQREIEALQNEGRAQREEVGTAKAELDKVRFQLMLGQEALASLRKESAALSRNLHAQQVQLLKATQERDKVHTRITQINGERGDIRRSLDAEHAAMALVDEALLRLADDLKQSVELLDHARQLHSEADGALDEQRRLVSAAEREAQDAGFAEKECLAKIEEVQRSVADIVEQLAVARRKVDSLALELGQLDDADLRNQLQAILAVRLDREQSLAECRGRQEQAGAQLRANDEARLQEDQKLGPLRDRLAELRLKEQAARINVDQFAAFLVEAGVDETAVQQLALSIPDKQKPAPIQAEITRLTADIAALGAINMAALDELAICTERKSFLDSQAEDLASALDTLENAIKRIDRETRELMQQTFDAVNEQFGKLFPVLFGGGEARLVMTGEEILDAGVQVVARPPGKKNSTIHLLSGGEKAMTAISLVFSFFQLNPAPFCLLDEVDAPLDDANTGRFCELVKKMAQNTQFLYISHNKLTMEMASHLVGVTMQEQGVSRVVAVDIDEALQLREPVAA